jgi:hypothetical protein
MSVMEAATTTTATETAAEASAGAVATPTVSGDTDRSGAEHGAERAPSTEGDERDESGRSLSREAASYRRLRETEQETDPLRAQLDRLHIAEAERLAGAAGARGADQALLRTPDDFTPARPDRPPWHQPTLGEVEIPCTDNRAEVNVRIADRVKRRGLERPSYERDWLEPFDWAPARWGR